MYDCTHLTINDTTQYHGDVFDHPDYEYLCTCHMESHNIIPFLHCNPNRCPNYTPKTGKNL